MSRNARQALEIRSSVKQLETSPVKALQSTKRNRPTVFSEVIQLAMDTTVSPKTPRSVKSLLMMPVWMTVRDSSMRTKPSGLPSGYRLDSGFFTLFSCSSPPGSSATSPSLEVDSLCLPLVCFFLGTLTLNTPISSSGGLFSLLLEASFSC